MDLCFLIDISPFAEDLLGASNAALRGIVCLLYMALQATYSVRWGYKFIDSRSEPHAFETRYKSVAGYADAEFPAGSPLQKGKYMHRIVHFPVARLLARELTNVHRQAGKTWKKYRWRT